MRTGLIAVSVLALVTPLDSKCVSINGKPPALTGKGDLSVLGQSFTFVAGKGAGNKACS